ncbi:hypothetical protein Tcur_0882 [Thermomonospora curvata DSM 43183]|uniref:Uncharacterized protein n=1 Tax=Thermomonospora curvata (strain ATCC 19995 / DSM 43183 / JCM 3096 / KCTC 9072 / NBRC 15933 / NCIMB 10081 / Henssen B9) TaxID=471852 RepID=D1A6J7_THECD|nr:hypothetical protein Tcur_0882 [Thermomonospora curvata DSM 43183]
MATTSNRAFGMPATPARRSGPSLARALPNRPPQAPPAAGALAGSFPRP